MLKVKIYFFEFCYLKVIKSEEILFLKLIVKTCCVNKMLQTL